MITVFLSPLVWPVLVHMKANSSKKLSDKVSSINSRSGAYDSDPLDQRLLHIYGIELIAPHVRDRRHQPTQDGRPRRRYRKRGQVERLFAWLHWFRRLVIRWEYHAANSLGIQLGYIKILLRYI